MKLNDVCEIEAARVFAYTDGACIGNPGPGGWAVIMVRGDERRVRRGHELRTTNQRMEMMAAIGAIESMKTDAPLTIVSDSLYLVKGMNEWLPGWKCKAWKSSKGKPVENPDLWQRLDGLVAARIHGVRFEWTKAHAGNALNEEADRLAHAAARRMAAIAGGDLKAAA